jgi:hypothetical protein
MAMSMQSVYGLLLALGGMGLGAADRWCCEKTLGARLVIHRNTIRVAVTAPGPSGTSKSTSLVLFADTADRIHTSIYILSSARTPFKTVIS